MQAGLTGSDLNGFMLKGVANDKTINLDTHICLEDEYIKDNMLYCKKCNGERYLEIKDNNGLIRLQVRTLCDCQKQERDRLKEEEERYKRFLKIESIKQDSLLANRYKNSSFENIDTVKPVRELKITNFDLALEKTKSFVNNWERLKNKSCGIFLYGDTGVGKTELTACIGNELMKNYIPVIFTSFVEIQKTLRANFNNNNFSELKYINLLSNIDLLILDDLGTENLKRQENSWLQEKIYDIINSRYNNNKPIIFSSNNSIKELYNLGYEMRTVERINEMSTFQIEMKGSSYRRYVKENDLF